MCPRSGGTLRRCHKGSLGHSTAPLPIRHIFHLRWRPKFLVPFLRCAGHVMLSLHPLLQGILVLFLSCGGHVMPSPQPLLQRLLVLLFCCGGHVRQSHDGVLCDHEKGGLPPVTFRLVLSWNFIIFDDVQCLCLLFFLRFFFRFLPRLLIFHVLLWRWWYGRQLHQAPLDGNHTVLIVLHRAKALSVATPLASLTPGPSHPAFSTLMPKL
mmetsp:Transcript_134405/g.268240  ORF Transcript_134405/g.268240 Transcript_134405/m.268240 type:complete len:210 (+) Transcript_134405:866-1495(+)